MSELSVSCKMTASTGAATSSLSNKPNITAMNASKIAVRSPFVGFNEVINSLSVHEKGLRTGFYNSIALIFLLFVLIVIYYCYWILKPFLQPLVWAILCGSALHPFKQRLFLCSNKWIKDVKSEGRPISLAAICLPFVVITKANERIFAFGLKYWKMICLIGLYYVLSGWFSQIFYYFINNSIVNMVLVLMRLSSHLTDPTNSLIIFSVTIAYLIGLSFGWSESTQIFFTFSAPFIWITFLIHLISLSGTVGYLLSSVIISIAVIGLIKAIVTGETASSARDQIDGIINWSQKLKSFILWISTNVISFLFKDKEDTNNDQKNCDNNDETYENDSDDCKTDQMDSTIKTPIYESKSKSGPNSRRMSLMSTNEENENKSNLYLCLVLCALLVVQIQNLSTYIVILFISIPLVFMILKSGSTYVSNFIVNNIHRFNGFFEKRIDVLFHPFMKKSFNYFITGDEVIMNTMESSLNGITSLTIICFTIVSVLFFGIFMSIQIYGESLHLVNSVSNVFNKTISYYPESSQLLPESFKGVDGMLDQMVRNGYEYGREYIKDSIQHAFNVDGNDTKSIAVEKQILEIWDRAYNLWLIRNTNDTESVPKKGPYEIDKLYSAFLSLDLYLIFNILKENIDILMSVLDSVWLVLKGNVTLLFSFITAVVSIVLGGGLGLMNLALSFVIFTTALFYLLSASGKYYKPIELVNRIFPSEQTNSCFTGNKFGRAVEEAINGVFAASLKMSSFYGLYTFLIHTLFNVDIVYIPSVMAAVFGAVPFLSAFWASFPAFLELFFGQNQRIKAILLLITAYFPSLFVDSTIYSEIKSAGHPYLTGLAIAGGVFYLGFEGALFGPILLCFLFVAFNIYTSIMEENPLEGNQRAQELTSGRHSTSVIPQFRKQQSIC